MRVGMGYDVHKLVEDRKLILGGVEIPYEKGLLGHSDADVLLHAIMDALLGAAALGDIGKHFPDTDDRYKGADSMVLLKEVKKLLDENFFFIENIDATVIAQQPKLAPYIEDMRKNIAEDKIRRVQHFFARTEVAREKQLRAVVLLCVLKRRPGVLMLQKNTRVG